jgi:hypothetical protein
MTDEQHDIDDRHDSIVVEGDDKDHVLPPTELDRACARRGHDRGRAHRDHSLSRLAVSG